MTNLDRSIFNAITDDNLNAILDTCPAKLKITGDYKGFNQLILYCMTKF